MRGHLPLLLSFGAVDVALEFVLGVLADDELVSPEGGVDDDDPLVADDEVDEGGVPAALDELDGVLDDEAAFSLPVELGVDDDEDDDIEPLVEGGVVVDEEDDVDGDGVTTGGVVVFVDDVSRLHPARPRTTPLTSNVINAVFIAISNRWLMGCPLPDLAVSMPWDGTAAGRKFHGESMLSSIGNANFGRLACAGRLTPGHRFAPAGGNNYAGMRSADAPQCVRREDSCRSVQLRVSVRSLRPSSLLAGTNFPMTNALDRCLTH